MSAYRPIPHARPTLLTGLLAVALAVALFAGSSAAVATARAAPATAAATTYLNLSATSALSFVPDSLSVTPGAPVVLKITQEANFNHTFTLSSVANFTIPSADTTAQVYTFFQTHPPLVNLSLGAVPGAAVFANFTAPAAGTYEFVCEIAGHFQAGMHGFLVSGSSSGSSSAGLTTTELVAIGVVVVLVIVVVAVAVARRGRKAPPTATAPTPPPSA